MPHIEYLIENIKKKKSEKNSIWDTNSTCGHLNTRSMMPNIYANST